MLSVVCVLPAWSQVPASLNGRLLFRLGGADAGHESYSVERTADGYRLSGDVDLQVVGMHIVQHLEVEASPGLAFRRAAVESSLNDEPVSVTLRREAEIGVQEITRADSTITQELETPAGSILLTNNVLHHFAQFAWLHDGAVGESREFVAFPRVPVTVVFEQAETVRKGGESLSVRRYYLNLANRIGVYLWLADDGLPVKLFVPLQAFWALDSEHVEWNESLSIAPKAADGAAAPPVNYDAKDVRFPSDTIELAGTLTTPLGEGPWPAVVLISGSGPQDRDENTPGPGGLKLGIFRSIAESVTERGIAVLRYDDRGVASSGGDFRAAGLSDLVADVRAAVRYLRTRPEIDGDRIGLIGHSEGAIIAPIVAAEDPRLGAIVLMAGTAKPLDSVLVDQVVASVAAAGGDSLEMSEAREGVLRLVKAIREGSDLEEVDLPPGMRALGGQQKWLREHLEHDPLATIRRVSAPVLVVNGGQDIQVGTEHAWRLGEALGASGHADYDVRIYPKLNHLFAVSRGEGSAEYGDPNARVDPGFLEEVGEWLTARLRGKSGG